MRKHITLFIHHNQ